MAIEYFRGAELPDTEITWRDADNNIINFSSGYTFQIRVGISGQVAQIVKNSGITGAATAPNITISWATDELASIAPGTYSMDIIANLTASNKDRIQSTSITILNVVG